MITRILFKNMKIKIKIICKLIKNYKNLNKKYYKTRIFK